MPRLISRLLRQLEHAPILGSTRRVPADPIRRRRKSSPHGAVLPFPSLSPLNRTRSILLDDVNPVINASAYTRHKYLPPRVRINDSLRRAAVAADDDRPRHMNEEERRWWASPYCTLYDVPFYAC